MKPLTQKIYDHLLAVGSISGVEASALYRCRDLPKRISEIRREVYNVQSGDVPLRREMKCDPTGQRYARYYLCSKSS